jgi:hypothetical protein
MLPVVRAMHIEVLNAKGVNDQIISELVPLVEQMLDVAEARPSAERLRKLCNHALERAMAMSATDQSVFPPSLRIRSDPASPPITPPKLPLRLRRPSEGLRIDGVHLPDSPLSVEYTEGNDKINRSNYMPASPVRSDHDKHLSIDTVMSGNPSIPFEDDSRGVVHGGVPSLNAASPSSSFPRHHLPPSPGGWSNLPQPYVSASNGVSPRSNQRPISGHQSPVNEDPLGVHRNASRKTNRDSMQSNRKQSTRLFASISQVDAWIEKKKANIPTAPPVLEDNIDALKDRDQVCSMIHTPGILLTRSRFSLSTTLRV